MRFFIGHVHDLQFSSSLGVHWILDIYQLRVDLTSVMCNIVLYWGRLVGHLNASSSIYLDELVPAQYVAIDCMWCPNEHAS
jgi:hypothetical protein